MSTDLEIAERPTGKNVPRKYSAGQVDTILLTVAVHGGNAARAAVQLKDDGIHISGRHVARIKAAHATRYQELVKEHQQLLDDTLKHRARDIALRASESSIKAIEATDQQLDAGEHKDPSTAARNLATTFGIYLDKYRVLDDKPNHITEHRDIADILRALQDKVPGAVIDTDAENITDAQLTSETPHNTESDHGTLNEEQ